MGHITWAYSMVLGHWPISYGPYGILITFMILKTLPIRDKQISKRMFRFNHILVSHLKAVAMQCIHDIDKLSQNSLLFIEDMQFSRDEICSSFEFLMQKP